MPRRLEAFQTILNLYFDLEINNQCKNVEKLKTCFSKTCFGIFVVWPSQKTCLKAYSVFEQVSKFMKSNLESVSYIFMSKYCYINFKSIQEYLNESKNLATQDNITTII